MLAAVGTAGEPPREIVASFTQRVQPLLLNHCAAGACHGGGRSPPPRLERGPGDRAPDHTVTRANLAAFLAAVGPDRDQRALTAMLAAGHPTKVRPRSRRAAPLSPSERLTLDRWLTQVRAAELAAAHADPGVVQASAEMTEPATAQPNRFRAMLDAAANPPALPPPQEPQGVIFKNDEPPAE
jgi:hypothetical protein